MKIKDESFNIVIAGKWNRYILTPDWVGKNILEQQDLKVEFSMNMSLPPRFATNEVRFYPANDAVIFAPILLDDTILSKTELMAAKLIQELKHTPISAFGINFGFIDTVPDAALCSLFDTTDKERLGGIGCEIKTSVITRSILFENRLVNLTITNDNDANVIFEFNFHYELNGSSGAEILTGNEFKDNRSRAYRILKDAYNIDVSEEVEE